MNPKLASHVQPSVFIVMSMMGGNGRGTDESAEMETRRGPYHVSRELEIAEQTEQTPPLGNSV